LWVTGYKIEQLCGGWRFGVLEGSGFVYEQKELFSMKLGPVGPPFSAGDADSMICLLLRWFVPAEQIVGAIRG
jgi:hypothetical protein